MGWVIKKYYRPIDLDTAGIELGTTGESLARKLGDEQLKALGIGAFTKPKGEVRREDWEGGAYSLMQRVAERASLGVPLKVSAP